MAADDRVEAARVGRGSGRVAFEPGDRESGVQRPAPGPSEHPGRKVHTGDVVSEFGRQEGQDPGPSPDIEHTECGHGRVGRVAEDSRHEAPPGLPLVAVADAMARDGVVR